MQLIYTIFGIVLSFAVLSIFVITLKQLGVAVGWGFHFQQPVFVLLMLCILIAFTFSQLGLFVFNLQGTNKINNILDKISPNSPLYHIFYGFVIALLATPCTAPMLGPAIGFALSQNWLIIFLIFFFVSIGLSFPYILLVLLPLSPKKVLPKAGNWLNYVHYIAAFLLYSSALWLVFVLTGQVGTLFAIVLFVLIHIFLLLLTQTKLVILPIVLLIASISSPLYITHKGQKHANKWHKFEESQIEKQTKLGKIVFIDITAKWCITCKFNKLRVLSKPEVVAALSQKHIYLMQGDMTNPNPVLLAFIKKHGRGGVPFNAVARGNEFIILNEILRKETLLLHLEQKK